MAKRVSDLFRIRLNVFTMKWHEKMIKQMLKGLFLFLFPLMILFFILGKAISIVQTLILPVKKYLPEERILGVGMLTLLSIFLIMLVCYLAGLLVERKTVRSMITRLENNVLIFIPGYSLIKRQTNDAIGEADDSWHVVLMRDIDDWKMGISVGLAQDGFCAVFFPEPPDAKSGEMKLVYESKLKNLDIPVSKLVKGIRSYGKDTTDLMKNK